MEQPHFTPSSAEPANDPFLDRPEADLAWKLPMLRELAELGMDMARDVRDRAVAEPKPEPVPEEPATADDEADEPAKNDGKTDSLARAFARLSRSVRMTLALHTKLLEDYRKSDEERAAERTRRAAAARAAHRANQMDKVKRVAEATIDAETGEDWNEREDLHDALSERLKDFDDYADLGNRSIGEIIARICRDLGLKPDWRRWVDAAWAKQEMAEKPPGSPYADWPPSRATPARKAVSVRDIITPRAPAPAPKPAAEGKPAPADARSAAATSTGPP
jgi:hypothetical protein